LIAALENINLSYSGKKILDDFSVAFTQNKITGLLGYSGSGKSTILKIINGMVVPDAGTVQVFGKTFDYANANQVRLKIGYAVQHVGLFPHMTVQDNITILANITKQDKGKTQNRLMRLLDMVQLPKSYLSKVPHQLSGGEQQRVGLCRAFFLEPPLVLMDEPFASLDYRTKAGIYHHLLNIQKEEPTSIIIVTHQFEEAQILCDKFIWLNEGKIYRQGVKSSLDAIQQEFKEHHL
jgi:osmoprotectant transport system ATP-binding protein